MRMKIIVLVSGCILLLSVVMIGIFELNYSYCKIPIKNYKIHWGMTKEEIVSILGNPSEIQTDEYGCRYIYEKEIPCSLGKCSKVIFFVGANNIADISGERKDSGLCSMIITIENTSKEEIVEQLENFYGKFSRLGGSTPLEQNLKKINPNYFNEYYFRNQWKISNLSVDKYKKVTQIYELSTDNPLGENADILGINVSGIEAGGQYACDVQLDAYIVTCLY